MRLRDDLMLQGTPAYPIAGYEPLDIVMKQIMRWFVESSLPEPFRSSPMAPSREAARDEVNVRMLRDGCSTTLEVAKFDRSRLCYAVPRA